MLTREQIQALIPHQGTMCLLDRVLAWSAAEITCTASSHLAPRNPLRRDGRLGAICGIEYGLQAAALHGALVQSAGKLAASAREPAEPRALEPAQPPAALAAWAQAAQAPAIGADATDMRTPLPAYLAALRTVELYVERLDDPAVGLLQITAAADLVALNGSIYRLTVASESGRPLMRGRATIICPEAPA